MSERPVFVERGSKQTFIPPYSARGVRLYGFPLRADPSRLQRLCDAALTAPTGGAIEFRPLLPFVLLTFADIARLNSIEPPDADVGWLPERDVALWMPVAARHRDGREQAAFYLPYLFVDSPQALLTGREVQGLRKELARVAMGPDDRGPLSVETWVFARRSPDAEIEQREVLRVERSGGGGGAESWDDLGDFLRGAWRALRDPAGLPGGAVADLVSDLLRGRVSCVADKQIRDVTDGTRAAYQAIVEVPMMVAGFRRGGLLPGRWRTTIADLASHPIASELGVAPGAETAGLWLDFDFTVERGRTLFEATGAPARKKIAILGGGVGGISTAFALTDLPGWRNQYEVTVYQMGWRLGGKGASCRNHDRHERIEEHGLHVWLGFYDNAFRLMRRAYDELARPPGSPLASWTDAFHRHDVIGLQERVGDRWVPWMFEFPRNRLTPGDDVRLPLPAAWGYVRALVAWMFEHVRCDDLWSDGRDARALPDLGFLARIADGVDRALDELRADIERGAMLLGVGLLHAAHAVAELVDIDDDRRRAFLVGAMDRLADWIDMEIERALGAGDATRRAWILLDLASAMTRGMLVDGVVQRGLDAIEGEEFSRWLERHGASRLSLESAPVRGLYDLVFGYEGGDPTRPNLSAAVAMRSTLSILFDYEGAVFWKMQAGMGDVVFAPLYQVLERRGVRFEFFHKVENLGLDPDARRIERVELDRQVRLGVDGYRPLHDVKGLPTWPGAPDLEQIHPEDARQVVERGVDLETYMTDWKGQPRTLRRGVDFDEVVLAIPVGAHRLVCRELVERIPRWRAMVDNLASVQTQAMQLWLDVDLEGLGWPHRSPVLDAYAQPMNTWADMTHLVAAEDWPRESPKHIAYFCGPLDEDPDAPTIEDILAGRAAGWLARERGRVLRISREWLERNTAGLWPRAAVPGTTGLDWNRLVAPPEAADRLRHQFFRANVDPSERYVLSLAGTGRFRLRADGSGVDNLFLAGDWIANGFLDAGCVEAAVISGLQCARAISGRAIAISWEKAEIGRRG